MTELIFVPTASTLLEFLLKASALWLMGWTAVFAARGRSAALRESLWRAVCAAVLILPLAMASGMRWAPVSFERALPVGELSTAEAQVALPPSRPTGIAGPFAAPRTVQVATSEANPGAPIEPGRTLLPVLFVLAWMAGIASILLPTLLGLIALARATRSARPGMGAWRAELDAARRSLGVRRQVRIVLSDRYGVPMVGAALPLGPALLGLPSESLDWARGRVRSVCQHECAHLARRDVGAALVARVALALCWPLPFAWAALRRMRIDCERACDDLVLGTGARASAYAEHLLAVATDASNTHATCPCTPMVRRGELEQRLRALLAVGLDRRAPTRRARGGALFLAGGLCLPVAALGLSTQDPDPAPPIEPSGQQTAQGRGLAALVSVQDETTGAWKANVGFKLNRDYTEFATGVPHLGVTALGVLALVESGALPGQGSLGESLAAASAYLCGKQGDDGFFSDQGSRMRSHALTLTALARLHAVAPDAELAKTVQAGVDFTINVANPDGAWRYVPLAPKGDVLNTAQQVIALQAARDAGFQVPAAALTRALDHIAAHESHRRERGGSGRTIVFRYQTDPNARITLCTTLAAVVVLSREGRLNGEDWSSAIRFAREELAARKGDAKHHYEAWYGRYFAAELLRDPAPGAALEEQPRSRVATMTGLLRNELIAGVRALQRTDGFWPNGAGPGRAFATAVGCLAAGK